MKSVRSVRRCRAVSRWFAAAITGLMFATVCGAATAKGDKHESLAVVVKSKKQEALAARLGDLRRWVLFYSADDEVVGIDATRVYPGSSSDRLIVWEQFVYAQPQESTSWPLYIYNRLVAKEEVDCKTSRAKTLLSVSYMNATAVHRLTENDARDTEWEDILPDSIGELLLTKECSMLSRMRD